MLVIYSDGYDRGTCLILQKGSPQASLVYVSKDPECSAEVIEGLLSRVLVRVGPNFHPVCHFSLLLNRKFMHILFQAPVSHTDTVRFWGIFWKIIHIDQAAVTK